MGRVDGKRQHSKKAFWKAAVLTTIPQSKESFLDCSRVVFWFCLFAVTARAAQKLLENMVIAILPVLGPFPTPHISLLLDSPLCLLLELENERREVEGSQTLSGF